MKAVKYLVAGLLMLGTSTTMMAQNANYLDLLKPIESTLKAGNTDAKALDKEVKEYAKTFKKDPKALVALGNLFAVNKDYNRATELANLALARNENYGDAYILLGDIQVMQDNPGAASEQYQTCMDRDPKNPQGYINYARVNQKANPASSNEALKKLKEINPEYPYEAKAGYTFYSNQRYEDAYKLFKQTDPNKLEEYIYVAYAITDYMLNKKDEALTLSENGLKRFPKDATFHRVALWSAVDIQNFDAALTHAQVIVSTDSIKKTARDYNYYGMALAGKNQYDEAIAQYQKALDLKKNDPKPLQYIAEAYKAKGDEDKALEYNGMYMKENPNPTPSDYVKLADTYNAKAQKGGQNKITYINKAIEVYNDFSAKFPSLKSYGDLKAADVAFQNEMDDKALEYYQKVIDEIKGKGQFDEDEKGYLKQAYKNAGYIYWSSKKNLEAAKPYFEELNKLDPNDAMAKKALGLDTQAEENK